MNNKFSSIPIINWLNYKWWRQWIKEHNHEHQWEYNKTIKNYVCPMNIYDIVEFKQPIKIYKCKICRQMKSEIFL